MKIDKLTCLENKQEQIKREKEQISTFCLFWFNQDTSKQFFCRFKKIFCYHDSTYLYTVDMPWLTIDEANFIEWVLLKFDKTY